MSKSPVRDHIFAFGANKCPGIAKLVEEAGEVLQVCGKLMMTGGEAEHWNGTNLKVRLEEEIGDLLAACAFVSRYGGLNLNAIEARRLDKERLFRKWREEQRDV